MKRDEKRRSWPRGSVLCKSRRRTGVIKSERKEISPRRRDATSCSSLELTLDAEDASSDREPLRRISFVSFCPLLSFLLLLSVPTHCTRAFSFFGLRLYALSFANTSYLSIHSSVQPVIGLSLPLDCSTKARQPVGRLARLLPALPCFP